MPRRIWFAPVVAVLLAVGLGPADAQPKYHVAESKELEQFAIEVGQTRLLLFDQAIVRIAVADPDVCDVQVVTPKQVLVTAKSVGYTQITLWGADDVATTITVSSARNLDQLRVQLKELFPSEPIEVRSAGDLLVLSGRVSDLRLPARAAEVAMLYSEKIANLIEVSGDQQVQLDVRFAEVSRTGARSMGMDVLWNDGSVLNGSAGGLTERIPAIGAPVAGPPLPFPATVGRRWKSPG
jgi:pilus assembly protein CpaC